jgi:hypothetical protein
MIIYTDLDYVLHHYTPDMLDVCYKLFGNHAVSSNDVDRFSYSSPFSYLKKKIKLTDEMIDQIVYVVDRDRAFWNPTPWGKILARSLINCMNNGDEVRIITARSTWRHAGRVVKEILGEDVPLFTCRSRNKHLIIEDNSIYFEDASFIINNVLEKNKNTYAFCPLWAWNKNKIDEKFKNRVTIMRGDMWNDLDRLIEKTKEKIFHGDFKVDFSKKI